MSVLFFSGSKLNSTRLNVLTKHQEGQQGKQRDFVLKSCYRRHEYIQSNQFHNNQFRKHFFAYVSILKYGILKIKIFL